MKPVLAFIFITVLSVCVAIGQSDSTSRYGQKSATSTQDQQITSGPVAEYISDSKCTIGWTSSASGAMSVMYGTDRSKMTRTAEAVESKDGRNYHVKLSGLSPSTRYYFQVENAGEPIGGVGTFRTVPEGASPDRSKAVIPE
ncbi:MAG TPA: fibronectin type III domain-containing protein [Candidatus Sulfotelmatobacter sp.]|nr:fibronectin type III domain-containing protein [Candidatus Sulfotelmatobacter sp.]